MRVPRLDLEPGHPAAFDRWAAALPVRPHAWVGVVHATTVLPTRFGPTVTWADLAKAANLLWWTSVHATFTAGRIQVRCARADVTLYPISAADLDRFDKAFLVAPLDAGPALLEVAGTPALECLLAVGGPHGYRMGPGSEALWRDPAAAREQIVKDLAQMTAPQVQVAADLAVTWTDSWAAVRWDRSWEELRDVARAVAG